MDTIFSTLFAAFVLVSIALVLIGIGFFITGKSKIKPGCCGKLPKKDGDKECDDPSSCDLCKKPDDQE